MDYHRFLPFASRHCAKRPAGFLLFQSVFDSNSSRKMPNSLLAGNIQGISSIRASAARQGLPKTISNQYLTGQFPTHPNREFFAALQGIKSGDQGNFRRDQGIPLSSAIWPFAWVTNPKSRQISKLAETAKKVPPGCREVAPAQGWISLALEAEAFREAARRLWQR